MSSVFTDQERYDREFERYMVMYKNGDIGDMAFGEFYSRQPTMPEDIAEDKAMQDLIDAELERNLLAMNCNRV